MAVFHGVIADFAHTFYLMKVGVLSVVVSLIVCSGSVGAEVTAEQKTAFLKQLDAARASADPAAIQALYEYKGASETAPDHSLKAWMVYLDAAKQKAQHGQPTVFLPLDSPELSPEIRDDMEKGRVRNGKLYKPNLPIVGFAKISSTDGNSDSAMSVPVGQEPDGSLRIACMTVSAEPPVTPASP